MRNAEAALACRPCQQALAFDPARFSEASLVCVGFDSLVVVFFDRHCSVASPQWPRDDDAHPGVAALEFRKGLSGKLTRIWEPPPFGVTGSAGGRIPGHNCAGEIDRFEFASLGGCAIVSGFHRKAFELQDRRDA